MVAVVEERPEQQLVAVGLEQDVVGDLPRVEASLPGDGPDAGVGRRLVLQGVAQGEDVVEGAPADLVHEERAAEVGLLGQDPRPHLGVAHPPHPLGQRQVGQLVAVGGPVLERVELRLVAHQHPEAAVADLRPQLRTAGVGLGGRASNHGRQWSTSGRSMTRNVIGRSVASPWRTSHSSSLLHGAGGVAGDLPADPGGDDLEDAGAGLVHGGEDRGELVLGGEGARHRVAAGVAVTGGAPGREPERTGLQAVADDGADARPGRRRWRRRAPARPSRRRARGVGHVGADVDGQPAPVERVEVVGERLPGPPDALATARCRGCPRRPPSARSGRPRPPGRTGANPTPQLPSTAVVTPCQHDGVRSSSHVTWPSKWVWMSTKPGRDEQAVGVDLAARRAVDPPHLGDGPPGHGDVGGAGRGPGAVDDGPAADHEVVHVSPPKVKSSGSIAAVASRYQPDVCGSWVTMSPAAVWK